MGGKDLVLDRKSGRFVAQQLRDQRKIEPLTRLDGAGNLLVDQGLPQRMKIDAAGRHPRQPRHADAIRRRLERADLCIENG